MNRKQNEDEIRAKEYLQTLKYTTLEYEPLGNVTPDFVIDDRIAIEVRRLNRNYKKDNHLVHIESCEIPIDDILKKDNFSLIINDLNKNVQLIIDEKNDKIDNNFTFYDEWWLILVDYITCEMTHKDLKKLKSIKLNKQKFTKIIILSPKGDFKAFEF